MKNQEKIFRRSKLKDFFLVLFSLLFVTGGYSILEENALMGWLGIFFFGVLATLFSIQLITNVAYLKLYKEGFDERTLLKTKHFKWNDVSKFEIRSFRWNESVHFNHRDKFINSKRPSITSSYSIKTQDLLKLMKEYKKESEKSYAK